MKQQAMFCAEQEVTNRLKNAGGERSMLANGRYLKCNLRTNPLEQKKLALESAH